jgi:acyl-CoA reductase-like NAD-dependent aldehyde dehydrogenase
MDTIKVRNPRNGEFDYEFAPPQPATLAARAAELRAAQPAWAACSVESRIETLRRWRAALEASRTAIVDALTIDTGRHLISEAEFGGVLAGIDRWCALAPGLLRLSHPARAVLARGRDQSVELPAHAVADRRDSRIARRQRRAHQAERGRTTLRGAVAR